MLDHLYEYLEPLSLADKGRTLEGQIPLSRLDRLCQSLYDGKGVADVSLCFDRDESGLPHVTGRVTATLRLQCQRCMQAMAVPLEVNIRLGIVTTRQAAERLPDSYDPLLISEEGVTAADIVEDELILALPVVAVHERKDCPAASLLEAQDKQDEVVSQRENPFAVLAELMKERND